MEDYKPNSFTHHKHTSVFQKYHGFLRFKYLYTRALQHQDTEAVLQGQKFR